MKNRNYYLRIAVLKTLLASLIYLLMPLLAKEYIKYLGVDFVGYTIIGVTFTLFCTIVLLILAWGPALDKETRENRNKND